MNLMSSFIELRRLILLVGRASTIQPGVRPAGGSRGAHRGAAERPGGEHPGPPMTRCDSSRTRGRRARRPGGRSVLAFAESQNSGCHVRRNTAVVSRQ